MFWIDTSTAVGAPDTPGSVLNATEAYFTDGNPRGTPLATQLNADWFNMVQGELLSIVQFAGIAPSKTTYTQVLTAIQAIINADIAALDLGQAAYKAVTNNAQAKVASISGTFTPGHLVVAADTAGTMEDGGAIPSYSPPAVITESSNFTPSATIGLTYRVLGDVVVNLPSSGLPEGWYARFQAPYSNTQAIAISPPGGVTLDGIDELREGGPRTDVTIEWTGSGFETVGGRYRFDSGLFSVTAGNSFSFTHNMEGEPYFRVQAVCEASGGNAGYNEGAVLDLSAASLSQGLNAGNPIGGFTLEFTGTGVTLVISVHGIYVQNGSNNGDSAALTLSDWSFRILGWSE